MRSRASVMGPSALATEPAGERSRDHPLRRATQTVLGRLFTDEKMPIECFGCAPSMNEYWQYCSD